MARSKRAALTSWLRPTMDSRTAFGRTNYPIYVVVPPSGALKLLLCSISTKPKIWNPEGI